MPATFKQLISLADGTVVQPSDLQIEQIVNWTCDSGRCSSRHDGKTVELVWDESKAVKDVTALPPGFANILKLHFNAFNNEQAVAFCSPQCLKDWMVYEYVPNKAPAQVLKEAAEKDAQMSLPFPEAAINPVTAEVEGNLRGPDLSCNEPFEGEK